MHRCFHRILYSLAVVCLSWPANAVATSIDPLLFEELVLRADFVGIVECEQAGGIVASYQVIESWKGPRAGSRISIRVAINYWEPQFPIALCGQRYFVTAYKEDPTRLNSISFGGPVPLWWRRVPADYCLPLFQGRQLLASDEEQGADFDKKVRKAAQALLAFKPAEQEAALLKAVMSKYFLSDKYLGGETDKAKAEELRKRIAALADADALVGEVLRLAKAAPEQWARRAIIVLERAGGAVALARLEQLPADQAPWDKADRDNLLKAVRERCKSTEAKESAGTGAQEEEKPPTEAELSKLRKTFADGVQSEDSAKAFELLTRYDPGPVADYLAVWKNPAQSGRDADMGYGLGSYFAWRCGKERRKHLSTLLGAKDPFVRVAGAVYLCFEDAESGMAALKGLTSLEGDPGVWAALTLARRGQKDAVPRPLEVFRAPPEEESVRSGMADVPHRNLQKRLLVLLSNAARAGNVPQLSLPKEEKQQMDYLTDWWRQHGGQVVLRDPWMKILEEQKVD